MGLWINVHLFLIQISSQIALISSNKPFIPFRNIWSSNYLQSSFMSSTTDVLFIVDNGEFFFTSGISDEIFQLFSKDKTIRIVTLENFKKDNQVSSDFILIEKFKTMVGYSNQIHRILKDKPHSHVTDPRYDKKYHNTEKFKSNNQHNANLNLNNVDIRPTSGLVMLIKNSEMISKTVRDIIQKNPTIPKIFFFYNECTEKDSAHTTTLKRIKSFSREIWSEFRVLFTYYIVPFCSCWAMDTCEKQKISAISTSAASKGRRKRTFLLNSGSTLLLWNEINNRIDHKSFIKSMLYVYDPFIVTNPSKRKNDNNEKHYGKFQRINLSLDYHTMGKIHMDKRLLKMNGYRLRIVFFPTSMAIPKNEIRFMSHNLTFGSLTYPTRNLDIYFGMETEVLKELAKRIRFTPDIRPSTDEKRFGYRGLDGTFTGGLGDVIYRRADCGLNGYFIKDYETRQVEFSTAISDDKVCVLVQSPALIPKSLLLFKVFSPQLWILITVTLLLSSVLYCLLLFVIEKRSNEVNFTIKQTLAFKSPNEQYHQLSGILSQCARLIAILLNTSVYHRFSSSFYERTFVGLCFWWGLNIIGVFEGSLVDVYTNPISYQRMHTLEDFDRSGLRIAIRHPGLMRDLFGCNETDSLLGRIREKMYVKTEKNIEKDIAIEGKYASVVRMSNMHQIDMKIPHSPNGERFVYVIDDCPRTYAIAFMLRRSSVFSESINWYLALFNSNGLICKWTSETAFIFRLESYLRNVQPFKKTKIVLNLSHLQFPFYALILGHFISCLIFILEFIIDSKSEKNIRFKDSLRNATIKNIGTHKLLIEYCANEKI